MECVDVTTTVESAAFLELIIIINVIIIIENGNQCIQYKETIFFQNGVSRAAVQGASSSNDDQDSAAHTERP